jgi:glutaredoxin
MFLRHFGGAFLRRAVVYDNCLFLFLKRFGEIIKIMSLVIYTKPDCPYCQKARDHYSENGIEFIEYDAQHDRERQREMLEYTGGGVVVPTIVENGVYIGSGWGDPPRG